MKKLFTPVFVFMLFISKAQHVDMVRPATSFSLEETKNLQSFPGAGSIVYINVASYYVYKNSPENIAQIVRLWRQTAEDLRPFDINVTTRKQDWDNHDKKKALHMSLNIHYAGGSCPLGMFGKGESIGGQNCQSAAQFYAFVHEIGHGFGIHHHYAPYDNVIGDGTKYTNIQVSKRDNGPYFSQWAQGIVQETGPYVDDIAMIASQTGFRTDDHGNTNQNATPLVIDGEDVIPEDNNGVISQDGDQDVFSFYTEGGKVDLDVLPLKFYNNLHAKANIVDAEGTVVIEGVPMFHYDYNDWPFVPNDLGGDEVKIFVKQGVELKGSLAKGTYYLQITNTGYTDAYGDGYTSYSSLGYYDLVGTIKPNIVGVNDLAAEDEIEVYPNPTSYLVNIESMFEISEVKIYSINGSLVRTVDESVNVIDVSSLSSGEYVLQLMQGDQIIGSKKIAKK